MVTSKRTRSSLRNHPTHSEAAAHIQNRTQTLSETNKSHAHEETEEKMPDEYEFAYSEGVYESDDDITTQQTSSSSRDTSSSTPFVSGNTATTSIPIVSGNLVTATSSGPVASGNSATTSAVVSDNPQAQSAATLGTNSAAASSLGQSAATLVANSIAANTADIIQMGNIISNDPPIPKRAATTHHTVFDMRHAVILSDTVDAKLVRLFLIQARGPAFEGHWSAHIQKTAFRLIKLRLMDAMYRTLVPENEIAIWPRRLTAPPGEALIRYVYHFLLPIDSSKGGIFAGFDFSLLLNIPLYFKHKVCILACKSSLPSIFILARYSSSDSSSLDFEGSRNGANKSVLSLSISSAYMSAASDSCSFCLSTVATVPHVWYRVSLVAGGIASSSSASVD
jgi:hypothetical protein